MPRLRSGKLRQRFQLQSPVDSQDSLGSTTRTWRTVVTRWGGIEQLTAQERVAHNQQEASEVVKITLRDVETIHPEQRLKLVNHSDYLQFSAPSATKLISTTPSTDDAFYRASNGAGSGDAWTVAFRFMAPMNCTAIGHILFWGGDIDVAGNPFVRILYNCNIETIYVRVGDTDNWISLRYPVPKGVWNNVAIVYDGGTVGNTAGEIEDYYSRFTLWLNGTEIIPPTPGKTNSNYGYTGGIPVDKYWIGMARASVYGDETHALPEGFRLSQLAVWDSDQTANIDTINNNGNPADLSSLNPQSQWLFSNPDSELERHVDIWGDIVVSPTLIPDTEDYADLTAAEYTNRDYKSTVVYNIRSISDVDLRNHVTSVIAVREQ